MREGEPPAGEDDDAASPGLAALYAMPGHLIRRSQQIALALFAEEVGPLDITPVQFAVMTAVAARPGIEAARISEQIAFDRSTLGDVLDRLAGKGLIERQPSATDRRVKTLRLTADGRALLAAARPAVARVQQRLLAPLPEEERAACLDMLRRIVGLHTRDARYRAAPTCQG